MAILSSIGGLSLILFLAMESVNFHRTMLCRQQTWLAGVEFSTRDLLTEGARPRTTWVRGCQTLVNHQNGVTRWNRKGLRTHSLSMNLRGKL